MAGFFAVDLETPGDLERYIVRGRSERPTVGRIVIRNPLGPIEEQHSQVENITTVWDYYIPKAAQTDATPGDLERRIIAHGDPRAAVDRIDIRTPLGSIEEQHSQVENTTTLWDYYNVKTAQTDANVIKDANETAQVLLTFAGLFSAAVAAFIAIAFSKLFADPNDTLLAILDVLSNNGTRPTTIQQPPPYGVRINALLFGAISIALVVAVLCIFVNQWTRNYQRELATQFSSPHHEARARYFLQRGVERYNFSAIVDWLSILMLLAVFLAVAGIFDLVFSTCPLVGVIPVVAFALGMVFVVWRTLQAIQNLDAPFRSPLSQVLGGERGRVRRTNSSDSQILSNPTGVKEYVKLCSSLDLQIILQTLRHADRTTERWLLDLCFQKIPSLKWVTDNVGASKILTNPLILETTVFLSRTCVQAKLGVDAMSNKTLVPTRFERAQILSDFLIWFLSFSSITYKRPFGETVTMPWIDMLDAYGSYSIVELSAQRPTIKKERLFTAIYTAYTAIGLIGRLSPQLFHPARIDCLRHAMRKDIPQNEKQRTISKCVLFRILVLYLSIGCNVLIEPTGRELDRESEEVISLVRRRFELEPPRTPAVLYVLSAEEKNILASILGRRMANASHSMRERWLSPLLGLVHSLASEEAPPHMHR